jgi:hypothetical protein
LGRDFKATHVRCQEKHALATAIGFNRRTVIHPSQGWRLAQPQTGQFSRHAAGVAYRSNNSAPAQTGMANIGQKTASVTARKTPSQPPTQAAQRMQCPQRPTGEEQKPSQHGG